MTFDTVLIEDQCLNGTPCGVRFRLFGLFGLGILVLLAVLYRRELLRALRQLFVRADHAGRNSLPDKDDGPA